MPDSNIHADTAAYALGALEGADKSAFESHLATCVSCRREVASYSGVLGALSAAAPVREPSPALRERILSQSADKPRGVRRPAAWRPPVQFAWLAAAASIGVAVFGAWSLRTQLDRNTELSADLALVRAALASRDSLVASFLGPEVHVVSLSSVGSQPSARVFWNHTRNVFVLTAFNIPPAPVGRTYQMWAIAKGREPMSMGTFNTDSSGRATVIVPVGQDVLAAGLIDNCAVTLEPAGGSSQPTEAPRLLGAWRHVD